MNLKQLIPYIPNNSNYFVEKWLNNHVVSLRITKARKTKLGDYRKLNNRNLHQITVNGDLNRFAFFFVFTHEVAHLKTFTEFNPKKINPHGKEWKTIFGNLLLESLSIYLDEQKPYILHHAKHPKASLGADSNISKYIINNKKSNEIFLEDVAYETLFSIEGRVFKKISKQRLRYICLELQTNKKYLINASTPVLKFLDKNLEI